MSVFWDDLDRDMQDPRFRAAYRLERAVADAYDEGWNSGHKVGVNKCIQIALDEPFLKEDGKPIRAISALWNIIEKMKEL